MDDDWTGNDEIAIWDEYWRTDELNVKWRVVRAELKPDLAWLRLDA